MVEDLCFHLVDMVQNSVAAGARVILMQIRESRASDTLELEVADDGSGMDGPTLLQAQDPFFTTKGFKKVGLGIPLLKATTEVCHGDFAIASRPGRGTRIQASMQKSHPDCPPLGDLEGTLLSLLVSLDAVDLRFSYQGERGSFAVSSAEARAHAGGLPLSHPDVYRFLREFIRAGLAGLLSPEP